MVSRSADPQQWAAQPMSPQPRQCPGSLFPPVPFWDRSGDGALRLGVGFQATNDAVPSSRSLHLL